MVTAQTVVKDNFGNTLINGLRVYPAIKDGDLPEFQQGQDYELNQKKSAKGNDYYQFGKAQPKQQGYAPKKTKYSDEEIKAFEAKDKMYMAQSALKSATELVSAEIGAKILKSGKEADKRFDELYTKNVMLLETAKNGG